MLISCPHCDAPCYTEDIISPVPERVDCRDGHDMVDRVKCPECGREFLLVIEYGWIAVGQKGLTEEDYAKRRQVRERHETACYGVGW